MWCTRWFLPLLLLPLPTCSPIFLTLFLFTLTIHAKPCFYCIILLATLFVSTCYWSPIPLDASLSQPWAENIITFSDALKATLSPSYSKPLPAVIQPSDRCWCDLSTAGFFEPFNTTQWEMVSVLRLRDSLERQEGIKKESESRKTDTDAQSHADVELPIQTPTTRSSIAKGIWSLLKSRRQPAILPAVPNADHSMPILDRPLPLFRREYDLRRFGVGLVLDFGTSGS
ncbi:hypothetical protein GYMLUDRAFT_234842 [Collybiopsis luxurians FD-317 M1]|nr:hypothetical protein GYMLUDRAFT_234842 [Collybiopsis luxurians FD-317 M1]